MANERILLASDPNPEHYAPMKRPASQETIAGRLSRPVEPTGGATGTVERRGQAKNLAKTQLRGAGEKIEAVTSSKRDQESREGAPRLEQILVHRLLTVPQ